MLRILLLISAFLCFSSYFVSAQSYSYGFEGRIDDAIVDLLLTDLERVDGVIEVKIRYKSEAQRGEILLYTKEEELRSKVTFSPTDVKGILLNYKLTPLEFVQISKNQLK